MTAHQPVYGAYVVQSSTCDERTRWCVSAGHDPGGPEGDRVNLVGAVTVPDDQLAILRGRHQVPGRDRTAKNHFLSFPQAGINNCYHKSHLMWSQLMCSAPECYRFIKSYLVNNVMIWLMWPKLLGPKVITLSGLHCTKILDGIHLHVKSFKTLLPAAYMTSKDNKKISKKELISFYMERLKNL